MAETYAGEADLSLVVRWQVQEWDALTPGTRRHEHSYARQGPDGRCRWEFVG